MHIDTAESMYLPTRQKIFWSAFLRAMVFSNVKSSHEAVQEAGNDCLVQDLTLRGRFLHTKREVSRTTKRELWVGKVPSSLLLAVIKLQLGT